MNAVATAPPTRLSVGVMVDLMWSPEAGGHVKCWERLAEAAAAVPDDVDMTVHYLAPVSGTVDVARNARYRLHRPVVNTKWLGFTNNPQNHTDLAPCHAGLAHMLGRYDVIHATGAFFSLARTARRFARRHAVPLTYSFHTDTVSYTRHYSREILRRWFGEGRIFRFIVDTIRYCDLSGDRMQHVLERYLKDCDWVLASKPADLGVAERAVTPGRVSRLRRGIDRARFDPRRRDRKRLLASYGIPEDSFVVIFVGRVEDAKNVMVAAEAVRRLIDAGQPAHLLVCGSGERMADIRALLGPAVTCCGIVDPDTLGWLYASADVFAFPSEFEINPNVVNEARACGLPALVAASGGSADLIARPGEDGIVLPGRDPAAWAEAIAALRADPARRAHLVAVGRERAAALAPPWRAVLEEDLLPVWRRVVEERGRSRVRPKHPDPGAASG